LPPSGAPRSRPSAPTRRSSDLGGDRLGEVDHQGDAAVGQALLAGGAGVDLPVAVLAIADRPHLRVRQPLGDQVIAHRIGAALAQDRKSTRLNSSHVKISYAVFC